MLPNTGLRISFLGLPDHCSDGLDLTRCCKYGGRGVTQGRQPSWHHRKPAAKVRTVIDRQQDKIDVSLPTQMIPNYAFYTTKWLTVLQLPLNSELHVYWWLILHQNNLLFFFRKKLFKGKMTSNITSVLRSLLRSTAKDTAEVFGDVLIVETDLMLLLNLEPREEPLCHTCLRMKNLVSSQADK